jgi:DNA-binding transcriptional MerR regulator
MYTSKTVARIRELRDTGMTQKQIAEALGIRSRGAVSDLIKRTGMPPRPPKYPPELVDQLRIMWRDGDSVHTLVARGGFPDEGAFYHFARRHKFEFRYPPHRRRPKAVKKEAISA